MPQHSDDGESSPRTAFSEVADVNLAFDVDALTLTLDDLVPDDGAELVVVAPDNTKVNLVADQTVIATGQVEHHITASGIDVSGFFYITFSTGVTLYYTGDLSVSVVG